MFIPYFCVLVPIFYVAFPLSLKKVCLITAVFGLKAFSVSAKSSMLTNVTSIPMRDAYVLNNILAPE